MPRSSLCSHRPRRGSLAVDVFSQTAGPSRSTSSSRPSGPEGSASWRRERRGGDWGRSSSPWPHARAGRARSMTGPTERPASAPSSEMRPGHRVSTEGSARPTRRAAWPPTVARSPSGRSARRAGIRAYAIRAPACVTPIRSPSSARRRSIPTRTCSCTTWARGWPARSWRATPHRRSGAPRRCGGSARANASRAAPPPRRSRSDHRRSDPLARRRGRRGARRLRGALRRRPRGAARVPPLALKTASAKP